jgi:hypothetical protein
MAINHNRRLDRLEETHRPKEEYRRGHRVIGHDDREIEREKQKLSGAKADIAGLPR